MGQAQKDEMWRITHENRKLLTAVQERKPTLNRNDWLMHRLDHQYQITKMSEFKRTVPMGEIIRQEQVRTSQKSRPSTTAPSTASRRTAKKPARSTASYEDEEQKLNAGMMKEGLTGEQKPAEDSGDLKLEDDMMKDALTGEMEAEKAAEAEEKRAEQPEEEENEHKLDDDMMKDALTGEMQAEEPATESEPPKQQGGGLLLDVNMMKDAIDGED